MIQKQNVSVHTRDYRKETASIKSVKWILKLACRKCKSVIINKQEMQNMKIVPFTENEKISIEENIKIYKIISGMCETKSCNAKKN